MCTTHSFLMVRKTTSIKVDVSLWKQVKKHCIDVEIDISDYIENLINQDMKSK